MWHRLERITVLEHEIAQASVRDRLDAVIDGEHRADVRVHDEASQRAQYFLRVVRFLGAAAFGVRDGDDAIQARMNAGKRLQTGGQLARETGSARSRAENDDRIARTDAPITRSAVTRKRAWLRHAGDGGG